MVTCTHCGSEASTPLKTWEMIGKPIKGTRLKMKIGFFECPSCHKKFRVALEKTQVT